MGKWLCIISISLLVLTGCGEDEPTRPNTFTTLTSIVITSAVVSLPAGVSTQLIATGIFSGLFTRDITSEVAWSSNQPTVANFLPEFPPGRVKALIPGPTIMIASLDRVSSGGLTLTVNDALLTALTIAPLLPSFPLGLSQSFTAQGTFTDLITRDLTKDVTWSSSNEAVATISDDFSNKGQATSLQLGTTDISAHFGIGPTASTTLTVTAATLSTIEVRPVNPSLLSLSTQAFSAMGKFSDGTSRDVTADAGITWVSSNPVVATIATDSIIKAQIPGLSAIKATLGTVSGTSNLKVTGGALKSIALTLPQAKNNLLFKGTVSRVSARGTFDNGTSRDITGAVTLADDSVNVSVTPVSGNLAWVQADNVTRPETPAKIIASYGIIVPPGGSLLIVTDPTINGGGLSILEQTLTLASGTSGRFSLTGTFSSGSSQDLTPTAVWSSANPLTATVGNDGLEKGRVHAVTAGTAVITARYAGVTATKNVTVVARTLESLTISAVTTPATIIAGTEKKFKVTARYTNDDDQDVTEDATWTISDSNVAKFSDQVSDPGLVVAVDDGTATLTATLGVISDTETLTVSQ